MSMQILRVLLQSHYTLLVHYVHKMKKKNNLFPEFAVKIDMRQYFEMFKAHWQYETAPNIFLLNIEGTKCLFCSLGVH